MVTEGAAESQGLAVVLITAPGTEEGAAIGRALVEERLAACVNVVPGEREVEVEWDLPFRQSSSFYYLTGVEEPGAALLVTREAEALFLPPRDRAREQWAGRGLDPESPRAKALGFERVLPAGALE